MKILTIIALVEIMGVLLLPLFEVETNKLLCGTSYMMLAAIIFYLHKKREK